MILGKAKALDLCKHCSATAENICVLSPVFSKNSNHSIVRKSMKKINSILVKTVTVLKLNFSMNWPYMSNGSHAFAFK